MAWVIGGKKGRRGNTRIRNYSRGDSNLNTQSLRRISHDTPNHGTRASFVYSGCHFICIVLL